MTVPFIVIVPVISDVTLLGIASSVNGNVAVFRVALVPSLVANVMLDSIIIGILNPIEMDGIEIIAEKILSLDSVGSIATVVLLTRANFNDVLGSVVKDDTPREG